MSSIKGKFGYYTINKKEFWQCLNYTLNTQLINKEDISECIILKVNIDSLLKNE